MKLRKPHRSRSVPASRGFMGGLTDVALLFLCLVATLLSTVSAYHIETREHVLLALSGILAVLMMLLMNLPRFRRLCVLLLLCIWGYGLWRLWEPLVWGGTRIQCDVVNTIAAKLPNVTPIMPVMELPKETWFWLTTLWIVMVGVIFALVLAYLICRVGAALPVILLTLLPILPALCVTEAPQAYPAALLLAVWSTLVLTSLAEKRDRKGAACLRPMALGVSLITAALLLQNLPIQGTSQPLWAADLREGVIGGVSRMDLSAMVTRWGGFWTGSGSTEYVNLSGSGPSRTGRVALRLECSRPGKYYLRGYSADVYTSRRWEPLGREAQEELEAIRAAGVEPLLLLGEGAGQLKSYRSILKDRVVEARAVTDTMTVENVSAPGGCVYYPYALAALPEGAAFGGDSHLEREGGVWAHEISFYSGWERDIHYRGSYYSYYSDGGGYYESFSDDSAYRDFVYAHQLQVPENLRPILEDWLRQATGEALGYSFSTLEDCVRYVVAYENWQEGRWQAWASSVWDQDEYSFYYGEAGLEENTQLGDGVILREGTPAEWYTSGPSPEEIEATVVTQGELEAYRSTYVSLMLDLVVNRLAETTSYDLGASAPPAGEDYVDWFLNHSRRGYCMHYASAAALLLRAAGIPARYVSGYVADVPHSGKTEVTDYAAHAWVEYYRDGVGWIPQEATPGYQGNAMGDALGESPTQSTEPLQSAAPTPSPTPVPTAAPTPTPSATPEGVTPTPSPTSQAGNSPGGQGGGEWKIPSEMKYFLTALFALLCLLLGRYMGLKRRGRRLRNEANRNAAVCWIYSCHRSLKYWGGRESAELTALAEKAKFSQHTITQAEHAQALALLTDEVKRVKTALPQWKRPFFQLLWGQI